MVIDWYVKFEKQKENSFICLYIYKHTYTIFESVFLKYILNWQVKVDKIKYRTYQYSSSFHWEPLTIG